MIDVLNFRIPVLLLLALGATFRLDGFTYIICIDYFVVNQMLRINLTGRMLSQE
jgi:hypothetical protein